MEQRSTTTPQRNRITAGAKHAAGSDEGRMSERPHPGASATATNGRYRSVTRRVVVSSRMLRGVVHAWSRRTRQLWWTGFAAGVFLVSLSVRALTRGVAPSSLKQLLIIVGALVLLSVWWRVQQVPRRAVTTPMIVRVIARLNVGGPAKQVLRLTEAMNQRGFRELLVYGHVGDGEGDLAPQGTPLPLRYVPSLRRAIHPFHDLRAWWQILQIIRQERPQILHTHTAKAGTLGRTAAWAYNLFCRWGALRCHIVHTFHGHVLDGYFRPWQTWVFLQIERVLARGTDRLVVVSQALKTDLLVRGIGRPEQIVVIPVGVEFHGYPPMSEAAKGPRMPGQPFRIGLVGRLATIKNPQLFVEGVAQLIRQHPEEPIRGFVIGDGELRPKILQWIADHGLQDRIQWITWQTDLPAIYRDLEVVCCTSQNEGTPTALIEALAAGTAVVSADVGGVREVMGDGVSQPLPQGAVERVSAGCLFRADDREGFVRALEQFMQDDAARRSCGEAGRAYVRARFTMARLIEDYERLYRELLGVAELRNGVEGS